MVEKRKRIGQVIYLYRIGLNRIGRTPTYLTHSPEAQHVTVALLHSLWHLLHDGQDGEDTQYQDEFDSEEIIHQDIGSHRPGPSGLPVPENAATLPAAARTDDSICPTATEDAGLPEEPQDGEVTAAEIDDRASNVDNYGEDDERGPAAGDSDRKCASFETRAADSVSEGNDNIGETVERSDDEKFSAAGELDCVTTDAGGGASGSQISARVAGCVGDRMSSTDGSTALVNQQRQQLDAVECPPTQVVRVDVLSANVMEKLVTLFSSFFSDYTPGQCVASNRLVWCALWHSQYTSACVQIRGCDSEVCS